MGISTRYKYSIERHRVAFIHFVESIDSSRVTHATHSIRIGNMTYRGGDRPTTTLPDPISSDRFSYTPPAMLKTSFPAVIGSVDQDKKDRFSLLL